MSRRGLTLVVVLGVLLLAGGVSGYLLLRGGAGDPGAGAGSAEAPQLGVIDAPGSCPVCGMKVRPGNRRAGKAVLRSGKVEVFCAPRCLLVYAIKGLAPGTPGALADRNEIAELWLADHYDGQPVEARQAFFVHSSDIVGPMGPDIVPVKSRERAEELVRDHGGQIVTFRQIDAELIDRVIASRPR